MKEEVKHNKSGAYHQAPQNDDINCVFKKSSPQVCCGSRCRRCATCLFILGFISVLGSLVAAFLLKPYVNHKIVENMVLMEDGMAFFGWKDPPVTPLRIIYFFNLTNEQKFLSGSEKPKVEKIGPYVYSQEIHKVDTEFGENGETITYSDNKTYWFSRGLSVGDQSDLIVMPNIPLFGAFRKLGEDGVDKAKAVQTLIESFDFANDTVPFVKVSVKEFLWGYPSILMTIDHSESELCNKEEHWEDDDDFFEEYDYEEDEDVVDECAISEATLKPFGLFMDMNATVTGRRTLLTGKSNIKDKGLYKYAEGKDHLGSWSEERCNVVRGRDPGCLTIGIDNNETMNLYFQNFCRNINFRYISTVQHAGVETFRFSPVPETFNSPRDSPENSCYCHYGNCLPSGVFDIGVGCKPLSPVYMSWPHFLHGDTKLRENVQGIDPPNVTEHSFQLDIEPEWGITLAARARFQMNVLVKNNGFSWFENVKEPVFLPFLYMDEGIEGPNEAIQDKVHLLLTIADTVKHITLIAGLIVGFVLMIPKIVLWAKAFNEIRNID